MELHASASIICAQGRDPNSEIEPRASDIHRVVISELREEGNEQLLNKNSRREWERGTLGSQE